ncbi:MAG: hypothetical protein AUF79_15145 [Crenarchaeota archaeon 13_1_20CM_2_51_8]|nr:MAG: hypothetical protein AUF79_15145 [Crenarchaeota archaeon 13_1_20CM_2_51_8]
MYLFNKTGGLLRTQTFNSPPYSITFSADDSTLVIGTRYNVIAFDWSGKILWNWNMPSGSGVSSLATASDGSYTLAGLGARADFGQTILVFNNQGILLWGKPVGTARQIALSSDGSDAAIAAWPMISSTSFPSGSIYLLPGPRALARDTGPVYSLLYFGQSTGLIPTAVILPAAISATLIAVTIVRSRNRAKKKPGAKPESPKTS